MFLLAKLNENIQLLGRLLCLRFSPFLNVSLEVLPIWRAGVFLSAIEAVFEYCGFYIRIFQIEMTYTSACF